MSMQNMAGKSTRASLGLHAKAGLGVVAFLVVGVGGWAAFTEISGAIVAAGSLVVDSDVKKVQHPTGGIVGTLLVRNGDRVKSGDVLIHLDDTVTRSELAIVVKGLNELAARKWRLTAELNGAEDIAFPEQFLTQDRDSEVAQVIDAERKLFRIRHVARIGQKAQLRQRIEQLKDEIVGQTAQENAKSREIELVQRELTGVRELWQKNLVPISKLTALEREATRIEGERAQLSAAISQVKGKIAETELQIIQVDRELSSEVGKELREIDAKIGEFIERKVAAGDKLKRVDIRAPQDGIVHQSAVHTVGGVINAGETAMLIVPEADGLMVEAKIAPQDIDQIQVGQPAVLRFSSFNQRTSPEIHGTVSRISADITADQRTGQNFYTSRIALLDHEVARLGQVKLMPGMPLEVFVRTEDRSVLSYLLKPMRDQIIRAFRER